MSTISKWEVLNIIGFKTVEREWDKLVNFLWYKIYEKHENRVLDHNVCGPTEDAAEIFVTGTSVVIEFNITMSFFMRLCVFFLVQ